MIDHVSNPEQYLWHHWRTLNESNGVWTVKGRKNKTISSDEVKFIRKHSEHNRKDPYGYFDLLYKVHKPRKLREPVPTRPVCSDCGSITKPFGKWVDVKLHLVAQSMKTYFIQGLFWVEKISSRAWAPEPTRSIVHVWCSIYVHYHFHRLCFGDHQQIFEGYIKCGHVDYHAETLISAL